MMETAWVFALEFGRNARGRWFIGLRRDKENAKKRQGPAMPDWEDEIFGAARSIGAEAELDRLRCDGGLGLEHEGEPQIPQMDTDVEAPLEERLAGALQRPGTLEALALHSGLRAAKIRDTAEGSYRLNRAERRSVEWALRAIAPAWCSDPRISGREEQPTDFTDHTDEKSTLAPAGLNGALRGVVS